MERDDIVLTRSTAPAALLDLPALKRHLRVDHDGDDDLIASLAAAAQSALDGPSGMVGKALVTQSWTMTRARLTGKTVLRLPVFPFRSLTSVSYYDADNSAQSADLADFTARGGEEFAYIEPVTAWPAMYDRPDALTVVWSAGYGSADQVPGELIVAAKMLAGHWYENREAVVPGQMSELPLAFRELVDLRRCGWVAA